MPAHQLAISYICASKSAVPKISTQSPLPNQMCPSSHNLHQAGIDNLVHMVAVEVHHTEFERADHLGIQEVVGPEASNQGQVDLGMDLELRSRAGHHMVAARQDKEGLVGSLLEEDPQNPADNLRGEVRFDNGHERDPESGIRCENRQVARWSFPVAEEYSDIQNWESEAVYLESQVVGKRLSRKLQGYRHCLPMLQDHGFESHSRWIQKSCRGRPGLHASGQGPFRQVSYDFFQLGRRQN